METLRWIATVVLAGAFIGLATFNWRTLFAYLTKQAEEVTPVPALAAGIGVLALLTCPTQGSFDFWWIPLVIDFGTLPYVVWLGISTAAQRT